MAGFFLFFSSFTCQFLGTRYMTLVLDNIYQIFQPWIQLHVSQKHLVRLYLVSFPVNALTLYPFFLQLYIAQSPGYWHAPSNLFWHSHKSVCSSHSSRFGLIGYKEAHLCCPSPLECLKSFVFIWHIVIPLVKVLFLALCVAYQECNRFSRRQMDFIPKELLSWCPGVGWHRQNIEGRGRLGGNYSQEILVYGEKVCIQNRCLKLDAQ